MFIKLNFWKRELKKVRVGEKLSKAETQREEKERGRGRERGVERGRERERGRGRGRMGETGRGREKEGDIFLSYLAKSKWRNSKEKPVEAQVHWPETIFPSAQHER